MYTEDDVSDAEDLYGKSKYIGELHDLPHAVTLRTSIIGHELNSNTSLVDWFLSQTGQVKGYKKAIFSGLSTIELARVIRDFVIPNVNLHGLHHISVEPIYKYSLLNLIADVYGKKIDIEADEKIQIDRSLNSTKFRQATGYVPPSWPQLIEKMHHVHEENN
jgi:dTDP-4-dehydrorhamnose reductase